MVRYIFIVCVVCVMITSTAQAASLYMEPTTATLERGQTVIVSVRLGVDQARGECINAIDGILEYGGPLVPIDTSIGNSILPLWVEAPVIDRNTQTVTFAGGIPNGYCGRVEGDPQLSNRIVDVVFRVPGGEAIEEEEAFVRFANNTTLYLNDGAGGIANTELFNSEFIIATTFNTANDPWLARIQDDTIPPEEFTVTLNSDPSLFSGNYYVSFNTTDKQSGLSHYEVLEEPIDRLSSFGFGAITAPWQQTRSPHMLRDQSLNSIIRVKAYDKAGNEYIASLLPDESLRTNNWRWINIVIIITVVIGLVIGSAVIVGMVRRRSHRTVTKNPPTTSDDLDSSPSHDYEN